MFKRTHFITNKKYQMKYTLYLMVSVFMTTILIGVFTFHLLRNIVQAEYLETLFYSIMGKVALFMLLVAALGLFLSHKIIGPIQRLESLVNRLKEGDLTVNIVLRKGDEFYPLADAINEMKNKLRESIKCQIDMLETLQNEIGQENAYKVAKVLEKFREFKLESAPPEN